MGAIITRQNCVDYLLKLADTADDIFAVGVRQGGSAYFGKINSQAFANNQNWTNLSANLPPGKWVSCYWLPPNNIVLLPDNSSTTNPQIAVSSDGGKTFTVRTITTGANYGPLRGIAATKGRNNSWLYWTVVCSNSSNGNGAWVRLYRSSDYGATWTLHQTFNQGQPTTATGSPGIFGEPTGTYAVVPIYSIGTNQDSSTVLTISPSANSDYTIGYIGPTVYAPKTLGHVWWCYDRFIGMTDYTNSPSHYWWKPSANTWASFSSLNDGKKRQQFAGASGPWYYVCNDDSEDVLFMNWACSNDFARWYTDESNNYVPKCYHLLLKDRDNNYGVLEGTYGDDSYLKIGMGGDLNDIWFPPNSMKPGGFADIVANSKHAVAIPYNATPSININVTNPNAPANKEYAGGIIDLIRAAKGFSNKNVRQMTVNNGTSGRAIDFASLNNNNVNNYLNSN